jgi:hypothetical protein
MRFHLGPIPPDPDFQPDAAWRPLREPSPWLVSVLLDRVWRVVMLASVLNALVACGDLFGIGLLLWQVPRAATVRNQGWRTFWNLDVRKPGPSSPIGP